MNLADLRLSRAFAWTLAIAFLVATVLVVLLQLDLVVPAPAFRQGEEVLLDNILLRFENEQLRWPLDLLASLLFTLGFAAVAGLGATLPRLIGGDDGRVRLTGIAFVVAGTLGIVGQLLYIGVKELGINAQYCECALRAPQLIGRAETLDLVVNAQGWLTDGFALIFGAGLLAASRLAGAGRDMPAGWRSYTLWMGVAAIAFVVIGHLLTALGSEDVDLSLVSVLLIAIVAGVLTPIWGIWTARALGR